METDTVKYQGSDLEDGELSEGSVEGYIPLQRPEKKPGLEAHAPMNTAMSTSKMDDADDSSLDSISDSDSSSASDSQLKRMSGCGGSELKVKTKKRPVTQLRVKPIASMQNQRPKKYNIWCESLQEESLMENMRGFDVTKDRQNDRSVETYDFSLKYHFNGENRLKRRLPSSFTGERSDEDCYSKKKRFRHDCRSVKDRLGRKSNDMSPRHILNLDVRGGDAVEDVARDIANKLYEEKDDLMLRVVQVLGQEISIQFFKETQRIELEGGMMIMNGQRRRTPGGVYLFLLKNDEKVSDIDKKAIFLEETKRSTYEKKKIQTCRRDQKVEELKKRLKDRELKPLSSRAELEDVRPHLKPDTHGTLSNPPPSPVNNSGQENSPDYSSHAINHVNDVNDCSTQKASSENLNEFEEESVDDFHEDILDMNCDDMDMEYCVVAGRPI